MRSPKFKTAYVYPLSSKVPIENSNPYIFNLIDSLSCHYTVINKQQPTSLGLVEPLIKIFKYKWLFLNWIENIPERKGGTIQVFVLYILLFLCKILNKKVIYILHNKQSHAKTRLLLKNRIIRLVLNSSNYIVTHAIEGKNYAVKNYKINGHKIIVIPHPVNTNRQILGDEAQFKSKDIDVLLWGTMTPYKGIDKFLKYVSENNRAFEGLKIKIVGKFPDKNYFNKVLQFKSSSIEIENRFISDSELEDYMKRSKSILFTYNSDSVLSSGALMDSLFCYSNIIGVNTGAFKEFASLGLIYTYDSFNDLQKLFKLNEKEYLDKVMLNRVKFIENNTWELFSDKLIDSINKSEA